jgi:outer membrane protein assembly factor BamE
MKNLIIASALMIILSGCSALDGLVYRIDIPQGNYLEQRDIDKLRINMSKAQVEFVMGTPVAANVFRHDVWHYIFNMNAGTSAADNFQSYVLLRFENDRLLSYEGTFERPANFDTPLDQ